MKQTIEIEVPDGKKAVWKDNTIIFEDIIKPQLPKTWEEFCEMKNLNKHEIYIEFNSQCVEIGELPDGMKRNPHEDRNILPSEQAAEAHLALMQLHQLRDMWREGWLPNWKDGTQRKYVIYNLEGEFIVNIHYYPVRFLAFQNEKKAKDFFECFKDLIEQAGDLI